MILQAAREHDIDLQASWMVGDSSKDVIAGKRAGCRTVHLAENDELREDSADVIASSLLAAVHKIVKLSVGVHTSDSMETPEVVRGIGSSISRS